MWRQDDEHEDKDKMMNTRMLGFLFSMQRELVKRNKEIITELWRHHKQMVKEHLRAPFTSPSQDELTYLERFES